MNVQPLGRFEWERVLRRLDLQPTTKLVALMLATYSNRDGSRAHPGADLLAADCGTSARTVLRHLAQLEQHGLILNTTPEHIRRYRRIGMANVYQLTLPDDFGTLGIRPDRMTPVTCDPAETTPAETPDHMTPGTDHMTPVTDQVTPVTDHMTREARSHDTGVTPPSITTPENHTLSSTLLDRSAPVAPCPRVRANEASDDEILNDLYRLYETDPEAYKTLKKRAEQIHGLDRRQYTNQHDADVVNREMYRLWAEWAEPE